MGAKQSLSNIIPKIIVALCPFWSLSTFFLFFFISPRPAQCRTNRGGGGDVIHFAAAGPTLRRRMTL